MSAATAPGLTLPIWFQVVLGVIAILGFLGGAWFALFIIWPSIRRQNRVSTRIENWIDGPEAKEIKASILNKLAITGATTTKDRFGNTQQIGPGGSDVL